MLLHCIYGLTSPGQTWLLKLAGLKPQSVCFPLWWCFLKPGLIDLGTHYLGHPVLPPQGGPNTPWGSTTFPPSSADVLLSLRQHSGLEKHPFIQ